MTGAPIPPGPDAVVPFEEVDEADGPVAIRVSVKRGDNIRFTGEDVKAGETILPAGTVPRPSEEGQPTDSHHARLRTVRAARDLSLDRKVSRQT